MTTDEAKQKIETEEDFVYLPRFSCSIERVLRRHPEGAVDKLIAAGLLITEEDVETLYQRAIRRLRRLMKVGNG